MAAYRLVYNSRHLQADCQEPGSAPEPYAIEYGLPLPFYYCYYYFGFLIIIIIIGCKQMSSHCLCLNTFSDRLLSSQFGYEHHLEEG